MKISGKIKLPGDKSISHRAALFSALIAERSVFTNFNANKDCLATLACLRALGIQYSLENTKLEVTGKNPDNWSKPDLSLDALNSGTTARLLSGILSTLKFPVSLTGDESLKKRPMDRVFKPLRQMGAKIISENGFLPAVFEASESMQGISYQLPVASAQVKSCVLLAGLFSEGETLIIEKERSRDHTERLLKLPIEISENSRIIKSNMSIKIPNISMNIPGDVSSATFFIAAALLIKNSHLIIENVSLNPTRIGIINILKEMNANIETNLLLTEPEPIGNINIKYSNLKNIKIPGKLIANIIDEIPILTIIASQADGDFIITQAKELRFKESDRIHTIVNNLKRLGVKIDEFDDGFFLKGPQKLKAGKVITAGDHRIAMAFSIASLLSQEKIEIDDPKCAAVSLPSFYDILNSIIND